MAVDDPTTWVFACHLKAHHFYATSQCTAAEADQVKQQIGETCPLCGAPIDMLDLGRSASER